MLLTIPVFYAESSWAFSQERLLTLWSGLLLFALLQQCNVKRYNRFILWLILLAVFIASTFSYMRLLLPADYAWLPLFSDARLSGIFQQPNVMASFLATGLAIAGFLLTAIADKKAVVRTTDMVACHVTHFESITHSNNRLKVVLLHAAPVLFVPILVLLASRTGWLAMVAVIILIAAHLYQSERKKLLRSWLLSCAAGLLLSGALAYLNSQAQMLVTNKLQLESPRADIYLQTAGMIKANFWQGVGFGQFEARYLDYTAAQHALDPSYPVGIQALEHPHNELLFWTVEGGVVTLFAMMLFIAVVLWLFVKAPRYNRLLWVSLLLPIGLHSQLEYPFYLSLVHWVVLVILLCLLDAHSCRRLSTAMRFQVVGSMFKIASVMLPLVISIYMLFALQANAMLVKFYTTRPIDAAHLDKIIWPSALQYQTDWATYHLYLHHGISQKRVDLLQRYSEWAQNELKIRPRFTLFKGLILAYQELGEDAQAKAVAETAKRFFPNKQIDLKRK
ncbi:MAG: Wzy polymerase domain-containing protein [Enterovibrio sp.]